MYVEEIKDADGKLDFRAMANKLARDEKIRWAEACLEIKRRYGAAACTAFGAPPPREAD